jgi:hypothetical protein
VHLLHDRNTERLDAAGKLVNGNGSAAPNGGTAPSGGTAPNGGTAPSGTAAPNGIRPANGDARPRRAGVSAIAELSAGRKATVEGKVRAVEIRPVEHNCVFEASVADETGTLTAKFYGRTNIQGFEPGARVRLTGKVSVPEGGPAMINPAYELQPRG